MAIFSRILTMLTIHLLLGPQQFLFVHGINDGASRLSIEKPLLASTAKLTPMSEMLNIDKNIGPGMQLLGTTAATNTGTIDTTAAREFPQDAFKTSRQGMTFQMKFDLPPGTYDVQIGFVETTSCGLGERVFNVLIDGKSRLEAYDIFKEAKGCHKAIIETFVDQMVDSVMTKPLEVQFQAVAGEASISYIRVRPSQKQCVPVSDDPTVSADHLAHAVPGTYPPGGAPSYVDHEGRGFVNVKIDGRGSHTHFSYNGNNGKLTSYIWTNAETGKVVSKKVQFSKDFPLGTTRLKLTITDDACTSHEAETSVSVTGNIQPGAYCYYYQGLSDLPGPGTLLGSVRPSFAAISSSVRFGFPSFPFSNTKFVARCIFSVEFTESSDSTVVSVSTGNSGIARVYEGEELIIDSETTMESGPISSSVGLSSFEVIYHHTDTTKTPSLDFKINDKVPTEVSHDQSTVMPIISTISPPSGRVQGGSRIKISGFGLYRPLKVHFGSKSMDAQANGATSKVVFVESPAATESSSVDLRVTNRMDIPSNALKFSYADDCDDVKFESTDMLTSDGQIVDLIQPTAVSVWQDGKLYIGTQVGVVQVVEYNPETLRTKSTCHSEKLTDSRYQLSDGSPSPREILGLTFDPRDKQPRPYLSVSTLKWRRFIKNNQTTAWSNGAVVRLKPATAATKARDPNQCLEFDQNIVRNLPVSNSDHSVNELLFDQNGDLLIAVGGFTNMGLRGLLGGNWETYFSGAVVRAKLSKGSSFRGDIPYETPENLRTAFPGNGYSDVQLYATGVRNLFSMTMDRSGRVFAVDMGPNCEFGDASSSCSEYDETTVARGDGPKYVPGNGIVGPEGKCHHSADRKDKLIEIKEGKFYGHPNLQRAAITQETGECRYVDPNTGLTAGPAQSSPPSNYEPHLTLVRSPKTAIREYGSNLFCGKMRGDLVFSQRGGGGVWRASRFDNGGIDGNPFMFHRNGGLRIEENSHGDLFFPKHLEKPTAGIFVMRPRVGEKSGLFVVNAVPFRHGRAGGTLLTIGGWGFGTGTTVKVGNNNCPIESVSATEVVCKVPRFGGGSNSVSVSVSRDGVHSELPRAVLYMNV